MAKGDIEMLKDALDIFYGARDRLLDREKVGGDSMRQIIRDNLWQFLKDNPAPDRSVLNRYVLDNLTYSLDPGRITITGKGRKEQRSLLEQMEKYADQLFDKKISSLGDEESVQEYIRKCMLRALDDGWVDEVDYLQQIQYAITTRGTAQRNPIFEYSREAYRSFQDMQVTMKQRIARNFFLGDPEIGADGEMSILFP